MVKWTLFAALWICLIVVTVSVVPPALSIRDTTDTSISLETVNYWQEGFETGAFTDLCWNANPHNPWGIVDAEAQKGKFSARSGEISPGQRSELSLDFNTPTSGEFSFWMMMDGDAASDTLTLFIDGQEQAQWCGQVSWTRWVKNLSLGVHRFTWVYSQNSSVEGLQHAAWVDGVTYTWSSETEPDWLSPAAGAFFKHESTKAPWTHSR